MATGSRTVYIYSLSHPLTLEVRYVGKAARPEERYKAHLKAAGKRKSHCSAWLGQLKRQGLRPAMEVLTSAATDDDWQFHEKMWIAALRESGARLVNQADGGQGGSDIAWSIGRARQRQLAKEDPQWHSKRAKKAWQTRIANGSAPLSTPEQSRTAMRKWIDENPERAREVMSHGGKVGGPAGARAANAKRVAEGYFERDDVRARLKQASVTGNANRKRVTKKYTCTCGRIYPSPQGAYLRHYRNDRATHYLMHERIEIRIGGNLVNVEEQDLI